MVWLDVGLMFFTVIQGLHDIPIRHLILYCIVKIKPGMLFRLHSIFIEQPLSILETEGKEENHLPKSRKIYQRIQS